MPQKCVPIQNYPVDTDSTKYYLLLPSRKTSSTCSAHMLCLEMGCRGGSNRRTLVHASPSHLLQPTPTCHLSYFAIAVKPEGGGSEDGSDMEAEPGIPLKVTPNSQNPIKPQFSNPSQTPIPKPPLKPLFSNRSQTPILKPLSIPT